MNVFGSMGTHKLWKSDMTDLYHYFGKARAKTYEMLTASVNIIIFLSKHIYATQYALHVHPSKFLTTKKNIDL